MRFLQALIVYLGITSPLASAQIFPDVAENLELDRYLGRWYEVASTKPFFQEGCVCVTADYALASDNSVDVTNSCRKDRVDAPIEQTIGNAMTSENPAKFKVSFGNIPAFFTNYWVVDLAEDYAWAVVSSPFRNPIWILSRTPELEQKTLDAIIEGLAMRGFDTSSISATVQSGCW